MGKGPGIFRRAVMDAERNAATEVVETEDMVLHKYPDYETYRKVQDAGNKAKLGAQFVQKSHIFFLADYLNTKYGAVKFGVCHGVRRGREQKWFRRRLVGPADVIGTDIAETATDFPLTIQWDFHEENPEWLGRADFVYSNSWDHAYDPQKAFVAWGRTLRPGGLLLVDHTAGHSKKSASALDPFGASETGLLSVLGETLGGQGRFRDALDRRDVPEYPCKVIVFEKSANKVSGLQ